MDSQTSTRRAARVAAAAFAAVLLFAVFAGLVAISVVYFVLY